MEYTKDVILSVSYGEQSRKNKFRLFEKMHGVIGKYKIITTIISLTIMLMILDCILVGSFINILSGIR